MDRYINMFINASTKGCKKPEDQDMSPEQKKRLRDNANIAKRTRRF